MIGFIAPYTFTQFGITGNTALSLFCTLYSSPLHMHQDSESSLVVLWQRIYHGQCYFKSHLKSSCHSLILFLPLFCRCQFRRLDSIQFLCSQAHILAGWRLETRLCTLHYCSILVLLPVLNYVASSDCALL
jgi:hypothetical protein